jgi:predicted ArsR family transcriptional regulator
MSASHATEHEQHVRRALADERRSALVDLLRGHREGLDVQELAHALGLHPNTVRWHLGVLDDAGLIESHSAGSHGPGRPRIVYQLSTSARDGGRDEHRLLATILTGIVADSADARARAARAGEAWGRRLTPLASGPTPDEEATAAVVGVLEEQGFAPELSEDREIRMRRCPSRDRAAAHPEVVCAVHRGLVDGTLANLGSDLAVSRLDILAEPDLCIMRLAPGAERNGSL